jgi:coenzyme F420-reducing hydrogenase alpha subunit
MARTIVINPVTRIEGHAKVDIEIDDADHVVAARLHVLEFRGFERFIEGMQIELMPTLTTRICGTCPHAHHLVAAKCVDAVFGAVPPRAAILQRQLLNAGSIIHSHAIHFFALAGPDLLLGLDAAKEDRNIVALLRAQPDLAKKALRLRSLGQKIAEVIGGRGTHPVTAVAGGMSMALNEEKVTQLRSLSAEALELSRFALDAGKKALDSKAELIELLPLSTHDLGTVQGDVWDLYEGNLRLCDPQGKVAKELPSAKYRDVMVEEASGYSYSKRVLFKLDGKEVPYRVGPLARLNTCAKLPTVQAQAELEQYRARFGQPVHQVVLSHYARLIEMLACAELAVQLAGDAELLSPNVRSEPQHGPRAAIAHVEAPRGVLIHDYDVDEQGLVRKANFLVATQHNIASIDASLRLAAERFWKRPEAEFINGVEFAIRCYDPCLSCSTHQVGEMPMMISIVRRGQVVHQVRR